MTPVTSESLAKELRNIGPVCAQQLIAIGITSADQLKRIGAKAAYLRIYEEVGTTCLNAAYLYALEGAIRNCDWRAIPQAKKEEYKALTASLRRQLK